MEALAQGLQLQHGAVGLGPDVDGPVDEGETMEAHEEQGHAAHVFGMVLARQKTLVRYAQVRVGLGQLQTGLAVADGRGQAAQVFLIVRFVPRLGILVQIVDGVLLGFGPQALPAHIGAHLR